MNTPHELKPDRVLNLLQFVSLSTICFIVVVAAAVFLGFGWAAAVIMGSVGGALLSVCVAATLVFWRETALRRRAKMQSLQPRAKVSQSSRDLVSIWEEDALDDSWDAVARRERLQDSAVAVKRTRGKGVS